MTSIDVVQDLPRRVQYTAAGGQTIFPAPFAYFSDTDLVVYDNSTLQIITTDYTVSGVGDDNGGNITFTSGRTAGHVITIWGEVAIERLTDFQQNGPNLSASMNDELDRITVVEQDLRTKISRTVKLSMLDTSLDDDLQLPLKASRAGKYFAFDADGKPSMSSGTGNDSALRTDLANSVSGSDGARLIGYRRTDANSVARSVYAVLSGGVIDLEDFGTDSTALTNAIAAIGTNGGIVRGKPGSTYAFNSSVVFDKDHAFLDFRGCKITTTLVANQILTLGVDAVAAAKQNWGILGGYWFVNNASVDGFRIIRAQNLRFEDCRIFGARYGAFFDGNVANNIRLLTVLMQNCYTQSCVNGVRIKAPSPQNTSFDGFKLDSHASESDGIGVYFEGELTGSQNGLEIVNAEIQNSTTAGVKTDFGRVTIKDSYIETSSPTTIPSIQATNSSVVTVESTTAPYPTVDSTSVLVYKPGSVVNELAARGSESRYGASDYESYAWGPPNYPVAAAKPGHTVIKGFRHIDKENVAWLCTKTGASSGGTLARFMPELGIISIPFTQALLANGLELWHPQEDFIIEQVLIFVTTAFSGGGFTGLTIGTTAQKCFISDVQGAVANLTANAVLTAAQNADATRVLDVGKQFFMAGSDFNSSPGANAVYYYQAGGTPTAAAGKFIIRGRMR